MKPKCNRCGKCCNPVHLSISPDNLKLGYKNWKASKGGSWQPDEVYLLYPMLKYRSHKDGMYLYNCVHYDEKKGCTIQQFKPKMCSDYPYYNIPQEVRIGQGWQPPKNINKDCGYVTEEQ